eukprot:m51a1_g14386 putative thioredoxin-related transmembrane protein 1-like (300) ;mRNA; r:311180-312605
MVGRYGCLASLLALLAVVALSAAEAPEEGRVEQLAYGNMTLLGQGHWFLKLYAPWCGHCRRLEPTWRELAGRVEGLRVAECDASEDAAVQIMFGVEGFPTLVHARDGRLRFYDGPRELDDLVAFAEGGYASVEPASAWTGPLSLLKRAMSWYVWLLMFLYNEAVAVAAYVGLPTWSFVATACSTCLVLVCSSVFCIVGRSAPPRAVQKKGNTATPAQTSAAVAQQNSQGATQTAAAVAPQNSQGATQPPPAVAPQNSQSATQPPPAVAPQNSQSATQPPPAVAQQNSQGATQPPPSVAQ